MFRGELHVHLNMSFNGEKVEYPLECLVGIVRVKRGKAEMTRLGKGDGVFHGLSVSDLTDENNIRRLS